MQLSKIGFLLVISLWSVHARAQADLFQTVLNNDLVALSTQYLQIAEANYLLSDDGYGVLAFAVANGQSQSVKVLLDLGIDINKSTQKGTALHAAAQRGNLELVKLLVGYGADINATDIRDQSPLIIATLNRNTEVVNYLLSLNVNLEIRDIRQMTAMDYERKIRNANFDLDTHNFQLTLGN